MRSYTRLPHVADIRINVRGDTLPELFTGTFEAMQEILKDDWKRICAHPQFNETIAISASDSTTLLVDFLSELLARSYERNVIFCRVQFIFLAEKSLEAKVSGTDVVGFDEDIKAVTYHEAQITKREDGGYETMLVFDI